MNIYLASDHAAFHEKNELLKYLQEKNLSAFDLGPDSDQSTHYPLWASILAKKIISDPGAIGVLLCGSGIGVSIVANRYKGVRAALCREEWDAEMSRRHNDANVICFAGRRSTLEQMKKMLDTFLSTDFEAGRHQDRLNLFCDLGESLT